MKLGSSRLYGIGEILGVFLCMLYWEVWVLNFLVVLRNFKKNGNFSVFILDVELRTIEVNLEN